MRTFVWPIVVIVSTYLAGLVTFMFPAATVRPLLVLWFLVVCPGIVVVRFLRLRSSAAEWALIVALSLVIDGMVAVRHPGDPDDVLLRGGQHLPVYHVDGPL